MHRFIATTREYINIVKLSHTRIQCLCTGYTYTMGKDSGPRLDSPLPQAAAGDYQRYRLSLHVALSDARKSQSLSFTSLMYVYAFTSCSIAQERLYYYYLSLRLPASANILIEFIQRQSVALKRIVEHD